MPTKPQQVRQPAPKAQSQAKPAGQQPGNITKQQIQPAQAARLDHQRQMTNKAPAVAPQAQQQWSQTPASAGNGAKPNTLKK
jgi:hypothetical protein